MKSIAYKRQLKSQIRDAYGRVVYTYTAHHKLADRLQKRIKAIKIVQIVLTSISTVGFFATVIVNQAILGWVGGITSALSLGLNLCVKEFDYQKEISEHRAAANDLWDVREAYVSLLIDFETMKEDEIREYRNNLQIAVSQINQKYPATDKKSYRTAKKAIQKEKEQTFDEGEVDEFLPIELRD